MQCKPLKNQDIKPNSMRLLFLIIISSFFYAACTGSSKQSRRNYEALFIDTDTTRHAVLNYDSSDHWSLRKGLKPASLDEDEVNMVRALLVKAMTEHNQKNNDNTYFQLDPLEKYRMQLVPYINEKGEKEVWVNCFCSNEGSRWRKWVISWEDGGKCFFNLTIYLSLKTSSLIAVNGYG